MSHDHMRGPFDQQSWWGQLQQGPELSIDKANQRANALADECGRLRDANRDLHAENSRLRREVERLERRGRR